MQDSEIKLAQCARCQKFTWTCDVSGSRVAVDPTRLDSYTGVMVMLSLGRSVYEVRHTVRGKPDRLRMLGGQGTVWEPGERLLVADHGCGANASASVPVQLPPQDPRQAPATPGRHRDGFPHAPAPVSGSQGHAAIPSTRDYSAQSPRRATPATRRPSRPLHCEECGRLIGEGEEYVAIEHFRYVWAQHTYECVVYDKDPKYGVGFRDKVSEVGWDNALDLARKNLTSKPMETVELPE